MRRRLSARVAAVPGRCSFSPEGVIAIWSPLRDRIGNGGAGAESSPRCVQLRRERPRLAPSSLADPESTAVPHYMPPARYAFVSEQQVRRTRAAHPYPSWGMPS
jgi:hypothetical protein